MELRKSELRLIVEESLPEILDSMNNALVGQGLGQMLPAFIDNSKDGKVPHWFDRLNKDGVLPNLDGKTIGSVVEMLFVGALEGIKTPFGSFPRQRVNPARGVDLPDIDLGIKSPSQNYCTSEPFFSAYERLLGADNDVVVLLTDYQTAKKKPPLRLQIIEAEYLKKSQIADKSLCALASSARTVLLRDRESWLKKIFRFLAYVNQSDWRGRWLLKLISDIGDEKKLMRTLDLAEKDFHQKTQRNLASGKEIMLESELVSLQRISSINPLMAGVVDEADCWVLDNLGDAARAPSANEWSRFLASPLDGLIGMSFALQWRYNFGSLFR